MLTRVGAIALPNCMRVLAGSWSKLLRLVNTPPSMNKTRVLVFGATGIGKTSICNALSGRSRPTDGGAKGVTSKSHLYAPFTLHSRKVELVDTVGLHESNAGTVPADKAVLQLVELLGQAKEGFSLLVHVMRAPRLTKDFEDDHKFFVEQMTQRKIPVLLVVTGCENEAPMQSWVDANGPSFAQFGCQGIIATCFAEGGPLESHFAPLRAESNILLRQSIDRLALAEPKLIYGGDTGNTFDEVLTKLWNSFVEISGLPKKCRRELNESVYTLMKRIGVSEKIAQMAKKHLPDLAEELGNTTHLPWAGKIFRNVTSSVLEKVTAKK